MTSQNVLIVEDELDIARLIAFHLDRDGLASTIAPTGKGALDEMERRTPDLVVLDIMLPDIDGLTICRTIRRNQSLQNVPIIMVTAKGEESDIVVGLELGADDYVTKPFSPQVLVARVRAALRRRERASLEESHHLSLLNGELRIDDSRHSVEVGGELVTLTLTEYRLLHFLAKRPGVVRTRDQIVDAVHGAGTVLSSRAVDVHVAALRRKLGELGPLVETVRGVGYRLAESWDVASS